MNVSKKNAKNGFAVKAYPGDAKTLLAFNLPQSATKNLAGFTIGYRIQNRGPFYLSNNLRFQDPSKHAQDRTQSPGASINAPLHKFRWLHVPGSEHQAGTPYFGSYEYVVTPRYFDANQSLLPIDPKLGVTIKVPVAPFEHDTVGLGFARGFTQSQAFTRHFSSKPLKRPKGLLFDTAQNAGTNRYGEKYTYAEQYTWLGFTARVRIFALIAEVIADPNLALDVFAYDFSEPDIARQFLALAKEGRIRVILDNSATHHNATEPEYEDEFETLFRAEPKSADNLRRGHFGRYAHHKVMIVSRVSGGTRTPITVLTGSTNFAVTGLYVNSNHVLIFDNPEVAATYQDIFDLAWRDSASMAFAKTPEAARTFSFGPKKLPRTEITFSPHQEAFAAERLKGIADRITQEGKRKRGSVLFAVMDIGVKNTGPVFPVLRDLHADESIFSYGITDTQKGIKLYKPGSKEGVLVTGKPGQSVLPKPFDQIPAIDFGHQVHHKFIVCGFDSPQAVVYCGSSNLALEGEKVNGDNLISIHDRDIATVFAIEALGLVDHFEFLDEVNERKAKSGSASADASTPGGTADANQASRQQQAVDAGWFLTTTDGWVARYYDSNDLRCADRILFGG